MYTILHGLQIKMAGSKRGIIAPSRPEPITLWSFIYQRTQSGEAIEYLHDSGYWFSKYYGDYPYNHITAVDGDLSAGGGMEYPNITVIATMPSKHLRIGYARSENSFLWDYWQQ